MFFYLQVSRKRTFTYCLYFVCSCILCAADDELYFVNICIFMGSGLIVRKNILHATFKQCLMLREERKRLGLEDPSPEAEYTESKWDSFKDTQ